jgi:hypothetical protein
MNQHKPIYLLSGWLDQSFGLGDKGHEGLPKYGVA